MKPRLECCTPWLSGYPSGSHWTHSKSCPTPERGQKVRIHRPLPPRVQDLITHPAAEGVVGDAAVRVYAAHPRDCICVTCALVDIGYIEHHSDDDDDRTLEGTKR